ncbi:hypothetical protein BC835DRAFT_1309949 [Cytidiella melzeri]|nr:hypothetical protein BC835DRAFT_1309949 [Cytidiella melzeri]
MYANRQAVQVHISNLAAQTGASLFQQTHAPPYFPDLGVRPPPLAYDWVYNKTEDVSPTSITTDRSIMHAIVEIQDGVGMSAWEATGFPKSSWVMMAVIPAFEKWKFNHQSFDSQQHVGCGSQCAQSTLTFSTHVLALLSYNLQLRTVFWYYHSQYKPSSESVLFPNSQGKEKRI